MSRITDKDVKAQITAINIKLYNHEIKTRRMDGSLYVYWCPKDTPGVCGERIVSGTARDCYNALVVFKRLARMVDEDHHTAPVDLDWE